MARTTRYAGIVLLFTALCSAGSWAQQTALAASDFNGDGVVGFDDFLVFARGYGKEQGDTEFDARLDLDGNGSVDFTDFLTFAGNYGRSTDEKGPDLLYIADLLAGRLVVVNTGTNLTDLSRTVALSQPRGLAFSHTASRIYVAGIDSFYALAETGSRIYSVPLLDPPVSPEEAPASRGGFRVALSRDHTRAYVTEEFVGRLEMLDTQTGTSLGTIPVGPEPVSVALLPTGSDLLVAGKDRWLRRVNAEQLALRDSIGLEGWGNGRLAVSPEGRYAYTARTLVTSTPSVQIVEIDLQSDEARRTLEVLVPGDLSAQVIDLALSADGATLMATAQRLVPTDIGGVSGFTLEGSLLKIETATLTNSAELKLGDQVGNIGLSTDGRTAYVGGVTSLLADPAFRIFIVDLELMEAIGSLTGFDLPADIRASSGKPAGRPMPLPELGLQ